MDKSKILIIDDELDTLQKIIDSLYETKKYIILQSNSANTAISILKVEKVDLIITDWEMPDISGYEFIKILKNNKLTKDIPIIMATGKRTEDAEVQSAFKIGVIDFIRKPFDNFEIILRINAVVQLVTYKNEVIMNKNKEMAMQATYMQKNKEQNILFIEKLQKIEYLYKNFPETLQQQLNEYINETKLEIQRKEQNNLEYYFENLYPNFTNNLTNQFPQLSPSELRLCILLKMNMDSKTISSVLNKTEGSIKLARKRIRDKLNLDKTQNLTNYICSI